jgi:hypothetical protein
MIIDLFVSLPGLFNQFDQTGDPWFRGLGLQQLIELRLGQMVLHILHDVKVFPPAVQYFKAGLLIVTAGLAVFKGYRVAQPRTTPDELFA